MTDQHSARHMPEDVMRELEAAMLSGAVADDEGSLNVPTEPRRAQQPTPQRDTPPERKPVTDTPNLGGSGIKNPYPENDHRHAVWERQNKNNATRKKVVRDAQGNVLDMGDMGSFSRQSDVRSGGPEISNMNASSRRVDIPDEEVPQHVREEQVALQAPKASAYQAPLRRGDVQESLQRIRETTANHTPVDILPSDFQPYEYKALGVRRFRKEEWLLIADWVQTNDVKFFLRAVDATLDHSLYDLTIEDGQFLMSFHRTHSYPRSPKMMEWQCVPTQFGDHKYPGCGYENNTKLQVQNIKLTTLNEIGFSFENMNPLLDLPRMSVYPEYLQLRNDLDLWQHYLRAISIYRMQQRIIMGGGKVVEPVEEPTLPQLYYPGRELQFYQAALWVRPGDTLEEKKQFLEEQEDGELMQEAINLSRNVRYGVQEAAEVECARCGAVRAFMLRLEPASFVP